MIYKGPHHGDFVFVHVIIWYPSQKSKQSNCQEINDCSFREKKKNHEMLILWHWSVAGSIGFPWRGKRGRGFLFDFTVSLLNDPYLIMRIDDICSEIWDTQFLIIYTEKAKLHHALRHTSCRYKTGWERGGNSKEDLCTLHSSFWLSGRTLALCAKSTQLKCLLFTWTQSTSSAGLPLTMNSAGSDGQCVRSF